MAIIEASSGGLVVALLAAGGSTRFGAQDKLAALLGDRPLIQWAAQAARSVPAVRRILVTSAGSSAAALAGEDFDPIVNEDAAQGLSGSLRLAADAAGQAGAGALLILLADMPFVGPAHLGTMLARFAPEDGRPLFSRAPGAAPQPPALFPASLFPALATATGDQGARRFAQEAAFIEAEAGLLLDIDTAADLDRARRLLAGGD